MSAIIGLGLRLVRAGGPLRAWSIAAGNAIGVILLLGALALPAALYPSSVERAGAREQLAGILLFLVVPAAILLVTTGRLSSGVRDRRLAALRMIGVSPHQARGVAAVENGVLALAGAVAGAIAFAVVAPVVSRTMVDGSGWLAAPLVTTPVVAVGAVVAVVALSVLVGIGATWERELPGSARSEATRRQPRPWRLAVLAVGLGMLVVLGLLDPQTAHGGLQIFLLLGGAVVSAIGVALVTPLVTGWLSALLVRSRPTASVLAGRAIQTDTAGASRVVAGLGVAVFLVVGALGVLGAVQNTPQYRYSKQMVTDGPQKIWLWAADPGTDASAVLADADLETLSGVSGVHGVVPGYSARVDCGISPEQGACDQVFVGTCAQLALIMDASGCDDTRAARIEPDATGVPADTEFFVPAPISGSELRVAVWNRDGDDYVARTLPLADAPVIQHVAQTMDTWVYAETWVAFVPLSLVQDLTGAPNSADVIADGGTAVQHNVAAWADDHGYAAMPNPTDDLQSAMAVRVVIWTLCGIALGVGLLVLALTAADRAAERRRTVARQVMVGVPAHVLRAGQLLQVVVPFAAALVLSVGSGLILLQAYARMAQIATVDIGTGSSAVRALVQLQRLVDTGSWTAFGVVVLAGGLLVALSTMPLIRTKLSPELLRRE